MDEILEHARQLNDAIDAIKGSHQTVFWGDRMLTLDKSADFLLDQNFAQAFAAVRGSHKYDEYDSPQGIAWRLNTLCWAARCGLRTGGAFVECGVFKGDMAWVVLHVLGANNIPPFYLYDTFAGFSSMYSAPEDYPDNPSYLDFANRFYQQEGLYEGVMERFSPFGQIHVVRGVLPDSLAQTSPDSIGFLHIDLNSPAAEVGVLEVLWDRVLPGGVVVFDDYGWKIFHKQKQAEDEFMRARGHEILELPTGQGLVIKR
jgi:O-methyltransferase